MKNYTVIRKTPFVRILVPYIIGILVAHFIGDKLTNKLPILLCATFLGIVYLIVSQLSNKRTYMFSLILIPVLIGLALSICIINVKVPTNFENEHIWEGIIYQKPLLKNNSILVPVKLSSQHFINEGILKSQKVFLYTNKDTSFAKKAKIGDCIKFKAQITRIKNKGNPNEFDYAKYMAGNGVFFQAFTNISNISIASTNKLKTRQFFILLQEKALSCFETSLDDKNALGIVSALTLGYKNYLTDEVRQSFVNAGAIHVLAVSGLHVGIIFLFLNFMLQFLHTNNRQRIIKTIIIILVIWLYAGLTGLAPSVTRAAFMFSLISIGKTFNRDISYFNILAVTALTLLIYNPLLLFNIGFQLSFIAVGGIVYFQPLIYNLLNFKNRITDYIFRLLSVTLAAQLVTTPLILFYFHQFPSYFWLTNLLLIPLISVSLIAAFIFLLTSWIPFFGNTLSMVVEELLKLIYKWVDLIDRLPFSVIENIHFTIQSTFIIYLLILSLTLWIVHKKNMFVLFALSVLVFGGIYSITTDILSNNHNRVIFYNYPKLNCIGLYNKHKSYFLLGGNEAISQNAVKSYFQPHWFNMAYPQPVIKVSIDSLLGNSSFSEYSVHASILKIKLPDQDYIAIYSTHMNDNTEFSNSKYLYVINNVSPPKDTIQSHTIILGSTLNLKLRNIWKEYAAKNKLIVIDLVENGAFTINI
jgi:competence protein ComEC